MNEPVAMENVNMEEILKKMRDDVDKEIVMMKDTHMSNQLVTYLANLFKIRHKIDSELNKEKSYSPLDNTLVDERIEDSLDEYKGYLHYKEMYTKSNQQSDLDMAHQELGHFLQALEDIFMEVEKASKDSMEERSLIKAKIKDIYVKIT